MTAENVVTDSFPRRQAATRRFTLGAPRGVTIAPDGARVVFLRSRGGDDPVTCLWVLDVATGEEHLLVDPLTLDVPGEEDLPPEEKARRERVREQSGGVVDYATDRAVGTAAFVLSGRAFTVGLTPGSVPAPLPVEGPVVDPRPDPSGTRVAFVRGGALHVHALASGETTTLASPDAEHVTWGLADFVAAEEMNRYRGFWWAPDGASLAAARVDDAAVTRWHIADPANPDREPGVVGYPAAGTTNATVTLHLLGLDGARTDVDLGDDEYLADVTWDPHALLVTTAPRDQKRVTLRAVDPASGTSSEVRSDVDDAWVDLVPGVPAHLDDGGLVWCADADDARRLVVDGEAVTGPELQVRGVADVDGDTVLFAASPAGAPTSTVLHVWSRQAGISAVSAERGVASGRLAGGVLVVAQASLDHDGTVTRVTGSGELGDAAVVRRVAAPRAPGAPDHDGGAAPVDRGAAAAAPHPRRGTAPGAARPLRRAARPARGGGPGRVPHQPVVRRPGLRGGRRRRARDAGPRAGLRARGARRPRGTGAGGPVGGAGRGRRRGRGPRPVAGGDPGLVVRRVPRGARGAAPSGRRPRGGGRRPGDRLGALRHPLHRALPRDARVVAGGLRALVDPRRRGYGRRRRRRRCARCC